MDVALVGAKLVQNWGGAMTGELEYNCNHPFSGNIDCVVDS